jgi:5'-methylthioadenosine phosphorylase
MTVMPEAKLAKEAEMAYAIICLPSDYDCWRPAPADLDKHELLKEIIGNLREVTAAAIALIKEAVRRFGEIAGTPSPSHSALELAIWSNKALVKPEAFKKAGVLLKKYA